MELDLAKYLLLIIYFLPIVLIDFYLEKIKKNKKKDLISYEIECNN